MEHLRGSTTQKIHRDIFLAVLVSGGAALPDFQKGLYQTSIRTLSPDLEEL